MMREYRFSGSSPGYRLRCKLALLEVICSIDKANETQLNDQFCGSNLFSFAVTVEIPCYNL